MQANHQRLQTFESRIISVSKWIQFAAFAFLYNEEAIMLINNLETHAQNGMKFGQSK